MKVRFTCRYCGNEWETVFYGSGTPPRCTKCGDKRIRRWKSAAKVDYYEGDTTSPDEPGMVKYGYDSED